MKTWKLRITNLNGESISTQQALKRYVLCWIWIIPPLAFSNLFDIHGLNSFVILCAWVTFWALSSKLGKTKQFWHDVWSQTQLIQVDHFN